MWIKFALPLLLLLLAPSALAIFWMIRKRPLRGAKDRISAVLRMVMIACTVLSLAGTGLRAATNQKAAWLLLDASASMADVQGQALGLTNAALASAQGGQQMGIITFGERAMVEMPLGDLPQLGSVQTQVGIGASNLASALALAEALLPSDASGGIGVISDGRLDPVDVTSLRQRGIQVNALQVERPEGADAQVSRVELTSTAHQGQMLNVTVTVDSTLDAPATLLFWIGSQVQNSREVQLRKGENRFAFQMQADQSGVVTCEAQVLMAGDSVSENDRMGAYVAVSGAPAVLLVEGKSGEGEALERMLKACGMQVERTLPAYMPASVATYGAYRAAALVNVNMDAMNQGQISALESAVRELGCGLAVFGGNDSYALGNYRGSALEKMLPVSIDVRNRMELPSTALVLILDQSGSMEGGAYGRSPLEIAKEAACSSVEVLLPQDQVGVISFDDQGKWVWPLAPVEDVAQIQREIGTIRASGGTAFYTPLAMALEALSAVEAQHKHVIFLTDGAAGDSGYDVPVREMAQQGITLTTVAVGSGAAVEPLRELAELGGGRSYVAGEFDDVPKIFIQETMQSSEAYVQNRIFTPVVTDTSLTDFEGFPQLAGYLTTTAKPMATVSLASDREDPILAWWQYGAGRVLSWTSDVRGAWTQAYLNWDQAALFFGGMLNHVLSNWDSSGEMRLENGVLSYTAPESVQNASVSAKIISPDGSVRNVALEQMSSDRYEAQVDIREPGAYAVHVQAQRDGEVLCALDGGSVISYAREYDLRIEDVGALNRLSADTGGTLVKEAAALMNFQDRDVRARHDLTPWLMTAALILLVADIAQRRFNWERALVRENRPRRAPRTAHRRARPASRRDPSDSPKPAQTSERLWQNLQNRNRM